MNVARVCLIPGAHQQAAGLLDGLLPGGMRRHAGDPDAPGRVPGHGQDAGPGAIEQAGDEESRARMVPA
jgi:hypothetical protein